jgi:hypothetical protein
VTPPPHHLPLYYAPVITALLSSSVTASNRLHFVHLSQLDLSSRKPFYIPASIATLLHRLLTSRLLKRNTTPSSNSCRIYAIKEAHHHLMDLVNISRWLLLFQFR